MKLKLFSLPLTLSLLVASCGSNEETKTEKADPIYCYVFNTDSPIKLAQNNENYFVNELSFSANDTIKFVDNSLNPYKTFKTLAFVIHAMDLVLMMVHLKLLKPEHIHLLLIFLMLETMFLSAKKKFL